MASWGYMGGMNTPGGYPGDQSMDIMKLLKMLGGGGPNPLLAGIGTGVGALAGLFQGPSQQEKMIEEQRGRQKSLWSTLQGEYGKRSPMIGSSQNAGLMSLFRGSMQPRVNQAMANTTQYGSWGAPESQRMMARETLPLESGYQGQLSLQNLMMTAQRDSELRRLLAALSGA